MEYIATICSLQDMPQLLRVDSFLIGHSFYANRLSASFNQKQIIQAKKYCKENHKKIYVLVNKIFTNSELNRLKKYLIFLKKIQVDGIFFCDFAVFELAKELHIENLLVFYHETFLKSATDLLAYHQIGIPRCVFSKDATIKDICSLKPEYKDFAGVIVQGYVPIYYSKRKILSNFYRVNHFKKPKNFNEGFFLKEKIREDFYPVIENKSGTLVFLPTPLSYIESILTLKDHLSFIIFDNIFENINDLIQWIHLYQKVLNENQMIQDLDLKNFSSGFLLKKTELE